MGFQDGVGSHNLVFKGYLLLRLFARASGYHGQVGDDFLGVLSFTSTRLTGNQHSLILLIVQHTTIGSLSNSPEMRRYLISPLTKIDLGYSVSVQRVTLVRVDNNHKKTRVGVDHFSLVTSLQIPEYRSIIKEGQVYHVLTFLKLGMVNLANLSCFVGEFLMSNTNNTLRGRIFKIARFNKALTVSSILG